MNTDNVQPLEYLATAYDSTRPRELPPPMADNERSILARSWLKHKLEPFTVECGEFLCLSGNDDMDVLRSGELEEQVDKYPLQIFWNSLKNPFIWVDMIRGVAGFFAMVSALGFILVALIALIVGGEGGDNILHGAYLLGVIGLVSAVVYYLFGELMTLEKNPVDNSYVFNRLTGMVHLPREGGRSKTIPFDEFSPYLHKVISPHGFTTYSLILGHQYSNLHLLHQGVHQNSQRVNLQWEFQRQFMDVSQPLPDVPALEPLRQYDPATIEWDMRMGRPPDFWRNFPGESYKELPTLSAKAVKAFPWGAKRQHALYVGWYPTCFSEMTWRGILEPGNDDEKASHWQRCLNDPVDKPEVEGAARKKYFERLANLFSATFEARKKTLAVAKSLLANHELSSDDSKYFTGYVNDTEQRLMAFAAMTQSIGKDGPDRAVPSKAEDPAHLHSVWIDEIGNQAAIQRKISDYVDADNFEKHRTEHTKINFEAIVTAIDTLKLWEIYPGEIVPQGVQGTIGAFLVDLIAEKRKLDEKEVARLNWLLNETLSADQYLTRYAEKLKNDQAIKDLVSLLVYLSGFHWELVSFVVNQVDMLVEDMVSADGTYDEYEWQRIALYNKLLGKALGIEIEPPKKPGEVKE